MRILKRIFPLLHFSWQLVAIVISAAVYYFLVELGFNHFDLDHQWISNWGDEATIINGLVLGLLLAIRYQKLFDRWWEARTIWGMLVNDVRNLALKVDIYCNLNAQEAKLFSVSLSQFVQVSETHLREQIIPPQEGELKHPPSRYV